MNYSYTIPSFLYDKRIYNYILSCIQDGAQSYAMLSDCDKENILVRIIDVLGKDAYSIIIDSENFDKTLHFFSKFLKTSKPEDSYDLVNQMRENALEYCSYDLDQLFNEILDREDYSIKLDSGMRAIKDMQTGEIEWRKTA